MELRFTTGLKHGIPIMLGYFFVSFTFGLSGAAQGMLWWETVLISMTNLTSAGQFAGMKIMISGGSVAELALSQLVINLRYTLMAVSLSQKTDERFKGLSRWLLGFGITDEIYGVAVSRERVSRSYFLGLMTLPYFGWAFGTLLGAVCGNILPDSIASCMGIALYGMFIAIVVPKAKEDGKVLRVAVLAAVLSCCFTFFPVLKEVSVGFSIIICGLGAAVAGAVMFPVPGENGSEPAEGGVSDGC